MNVLRLALLLLLLPVWSPAALAQNACGCTPDEALRPAGTGPLAYAHRGNRCEGFVATSIASPSLRVISLTESVDRARPAAGESVRLEWPLPPGLSGEIRVHAQALRSRGY